MVLYGYLEHLSYQNSHLYSCVKSQKCQENLRKDYGDIVDNLGCLMSLHIWLAHGVAFINISHFL